MKTAEVIGNSCPSLTALNLNYTSVPPASLLGPLTSCTNLEVLKVAGISNWVSECTNHVNHIADPPRDRPDRWHLRKASYWTHTRTRRDPIPYEKPQIPPTGSLRNLGVRFHCALSKPDPPGRLLYPYSPSSAIDSHSTCSGKVVAHIDGAVRYGCRFLDQHLAEPTNTLLGCTRQRSGFVFLNRQHICHDHNGRHAQIAHGHHFEL